jgi:hypothetical protein
MKLFLLSFMIAATIKITKADEFIQILSPAKGNEVLNLIEYACEQNWCNGLYTYNFTSLICDENTASCRLDYKLTDRGFVAHKLSNKNKFCLIKDINSVNEIMENHQLTETFSDALDDCLMHVF